MSEINPPYIIAAALLVLVLLTYALWNYIKAIRRLFSRFNDPKVIEAIIQALVNKMNAEAGPVASFALLFELEVNNKDKYLRLMKNGSTPMSINLVISKDAQLFAMKLVEQMRRRIDNNNRE